MKPTFSLSSRGNLKLVHNGYSYVRAGSSKIKGGRWRCAYSIGSRYACKAKAFTNPNDSKSVSFVGEHSHWPN